MGFEPTTTCLGSKDSTTELRPPLAPIESPILRRPHDQVKAAAVHQRGT